MNTRHTLQQLNQAITTLDKLKHRLPATLRQTADHTDTGLKATNYDTAGGTTSGHSDPTTTTDLNPNERQQLEQAIVVIINASNTIIDTINNTAPDRTINQCSTCGIALEQRAAAFCTPCVNAKADQATEKAARHCSNCEKPMAKNEALRKGRCKGCDRTWRQTGRERSYTEVSANSETLDLSANTLSS